MNVGAGLALGCLSPLDDIVSEGEHDSRSAQQIKLNIEIVVLVAQGRHKTGRQPIIIQWNLVFVRLLVTQQQAASQLEV